MRQIIVDHAARAATGNLNIRRAAPTFEMNSDVVAGFRTAVTNNQITLALQYLTFIVDALLSEETESEAVAANHTPAIEENLVSRVEKLENLVATLTAPAKRGAPKKEEAISE